MADARFSPVFLWSATAYGFSPRIRFDLVLNNLTAHAFTSGKVLLKSDGTSWRPIVHIEDIGRAFVAALEAPVEAVHNEVFNVGITTENYRIREIAEIVEETVPCSRVEFAAGAGPDKRTYRVDCSKIARLLPKFRPQWTARRGARELYRRYSEYGLLLEDFEGARYQRLAYLQSLIARGAIDGNLRWIPCLGIDPADGPVARANAIGVPTIHDFFELQPAEKLASEGKLADVVIANNVVAHVDQINDFVAGIERLLKTNRYRGS